MTFESWALAGLATSGCLGLALLLTLAGAGSPPVGRSMFVRSAVSAGGGAVSSGVALALVAALGLATPAATFTGPIMAMGALTSALISLSTRSVGVPERTAAAYGVSVAGLVSAPIAAAVFASEGLLSAGLRTLDLAGALATLQPAAIAASIVLIVRRRSSSPIESPPSGPRLVEIVVAAWALWIAWLIGMELAIDEVTPRILISGVVAPLSSLGAWLLVQRLRHDQTTRGGAVAGLVAGLASITSACGYVDVVGAWVIGTVAGALGSLVASGITHRHAGARWLLPVALSIGSGTGIVALGIFSTRIGLAYTGQPELLFSQVASLVAVAVYSAALSAAIWLLVRRLGVRPTSAP